MKASCICVLWPSTKLRSVKMLKKKQTQESKTKKQQWQNKQTNKTTGPISCHLDGRNSVKKNIYYVCSHTKISSCEIKAEFVLAGKIDIHIN